MCFEVARLQSRAASRDTRLRVGVDYIKNCSDSPKDRVTGPSNSGEGRHQYIHRDLVGIQVASVKTYRAVWYQSWDRSTVLIKLIRSLIGHTVKD